MNIGTVYGTLPDANRPQPPLKNSSSSIFFPNLAPEVDNGFEIIENHEADNWTRITKDDIPNITLEFYSALNIDPANITNLPVISEEERKLAVDLISAYKNASIRQLPEEMINPKSFRDNAINMASRLIKDIGVFYRPSDKKKPTPISKDEIPLTEDEKESLLPLNSGSFDIYTQFNQIGYKVNNKNKNLIEFSMVHPLVKYLIGSYNNNETLAEINTEFFKISIDNYNDYTENKIKIDKILLKIYKYKNNNTLYLGQANNNNLSRNMLIQPKEKNLQILKNKFAKVFYKTKMLSS